MTNPLCLTPGGAAIRSPASLKKADRRNLRASQQEGGVGKNPASIVCGEEPLWAEEEAFACGVLINKTSEGVSGSFRRTF